MSDSPVVVQEKDRTGRPAKISWFANERAFYDDAPIIVLEYDPRLIAWNFLCCRTTPRPVMATFGPVWRRLSNFPTADVSKWMTHTVAEPGAPLEPITREESPGMSRAPLDSMSAQAAAEELDTQANKIVWSVASLENPEPGTPAHAQAVALTDVAAELFARAEQLRDLAQRRLAEQEQTLRQVARVDRARNFGIADSPAQDGETRG